MTVDFTLLDRMFSINDTLVHAMVVDGCVITIGFFVVVVVHILVVMKTMMMMSSGSSSSGHCQENHQSHAEQQHGKKMCEKLHGMCM